MFYSLFLSLQPHFSIQGRKWCRVVGGKVDVMAVSCVTTFLLLFFLCGLTHGFCSVPGMVQFSHEVAGELTKNVLKVCSFFWVNSPPTPHYFHVSALGVRCYTW